MTSMDMSVQFGSIAGIDIHKDRQSIYKTVILPKLNSTKPVLKIEPREEVPFGAIVYWCAENIETWQVVEAEGQKAIGEAVGLHRNLPKQSWDNALIKHGWFFYPKGKRPSEDEIDAMLDKWEAKLERAKVRREKRYE